MKDTKAEEFFQSKNGGQPSYESEFITPTWAVLLMQEYADQQTLAYYEWRLNVKPIDLYVDWDTTARRRLTESELLTRFKERP